MQFRRLTLLSIFLLLCGLAAPDLLLGQKVKLKGQAEAKGDTVKVAAGKGSIKATQPTVKDTLLGGNGFIPRTVIDSFPANPVLPEEKKKSTALQESDIASARKQIAAIHAQIAKGDSLLAANRKNPVPEWPENKLVELEKGLVTAKKQVAVAEKDLAALEKRYLKSMEPTEPEDKKVEPKAGPEKPAPSPKPAPAVVPGTGKGEIKGGK